MLSPGRVRIFRVVLALSAIVGLVAIAAGYLEVALIAASSRFFQALLWSRAQRRQVFHRG